MLAPLFFFLSDLQSKIYANIYWGLFKAKMPTA